MPSVPRRSARTIREERRQFRNQQRDQEIELDNERQIHFEAAILQFEQTMKNLTRVVCLNCLKFTEHTDIRNDICGSCQRSDIHLFTPENGMDLGGVPPELTNLSLIEQILIARVHPVVSVFTIRGQQRGYNGHVLNFVQHVEQVATKLPHFVGSLNSILLVNRETPDGLIQFKVRSRVVRHALYWLKNNNQYYRNILIDEQALSQLPEDGDVAHLLANLDMNIDPQFAQGPNQQNQSNEEGMNQFESSCFPSLPALNENDAIERSLRRGDASQAASERDIGSWPDLSQNPLNEFNTEGLICRAFPTLFPYGLGDLNSPRLHTIPKHKYFKYLLQYHDQRFAKDSRFVYYAYNTMARWTAINCGNVFVRQNELEGYTAEDLLELLNEPNRDLAKSIMYYGQTLRGTRAFWKVRCTELLSMVRQIGTPTIFFTLSAADYHWPDLYRIISPEIPTTELTNQMRRRIMHENPNLTAWFFNKRCEIFMKTFMMRIFAIKDFWYRFEWQHRGSPHIHGLLWLDDAPICDDIDSLDEEERQLIVDYFDDIVKAHIGTRSVIAPIDNPCRKRFSELDDSDKNNDLDRILSAVQIHSRCGTHCLRRKIHSRAMECRYGFPKAKTNRSELTKQGDHWHFIPARNDEFLQKNNPFVSQAWRGNTDFSAITSKEAVLNYISKYASKGEVHSEAYSDVFRNLLTRNNQETTAATAVRKLLISSVAERNYSAQEVNHLISGWPLFHSSRSFVPVSLTSDWRLLRENTRNIVRAYAFRPDELLSLSLYEFSKGWVYNSRTYSKRRKDAIIRFIPWLAYNDDGSDNEPYYKNQCISYIPWREDINNLVTPGQSWQDKYLTFLGRVENADPYQDELPVVPEEFEFDDQHLENNMGIVRDAAMVASRLHPNINPDDPLGYRPIDEAHMWNNFQSFRVSLNAIELFLQTYKQISAENAPRELSLSFESMSEEQKTVLNIVASQSHPDHPPARIIIQGKAGTGKSALIKAICQRLDRLAATSYSGHRLYEILAPTGAAAVNIDGSTYHSVLRIPINGPMLPLNGETLRLFQEHFRYIKWIIIDEYSMVGLRQLAKIHSRLCEASGEEGHAFGGFHMLFFGDLRQLPPVKDKPIYGHPAQDVVAMRGKHLMERISKTIILKVCHRQGSDQVEFKELLDSLATGVVTTRQWDLLMSRRAEILPNSSDFDDSVHLFPTNKQVVEFNTYKLSLNGQPIAVIEAIHNNSAAKQGTDNQAQGLSRYLHISVGARVMLRYNLCVAKGLVNGSLGYVRDIVYEGNEKPPMMPKYVMVEFDKYNGPFLRPGIDRLFPLKPISANWRDGSIECRRRQFPISLAYSLTIHKSQGLTLDKATVDIGDKESAAGISYVGLSRVRKLQDLRIAKYCNYNRLTSIATMKQVRERENYMALLEHHANNS